MFFDGKRSRTMSYESIGCTFKNGKSKLWEIILVEHSKTQFSLIDFTTDIHVNCFRKQLLYSIMRSNFYI